MTTFSRDAAVDARTAARGALLVGFLYLFYYYVVGPFQLVLRPRTEALVLPAVGAHGITVVYALLAAFRILAGPIVGRIGGRNGLVVATGAMALAVLLTFNAATPAVMFAGLGLLGMASAFLWSAGGAVALETAKADQRGWAASKLYVFTGIGLIVGACSVDAMLPAAQANVDNAAALTLIYTSSGFTGLQVTWIVASVLACCCALGIGLRTIRGKGWQNPFGVVRTLVRRGGVIVFLFLAGAAASYGAFYQLVTKVISDLAPIREHLGKISLPMYAVMAFSSLVVGPVSDRVGRRAVLLQGVLCGAAGFALLGVIAGIANPAPWMCWTSVGVGCFALGWCFSSVQTAAMAWIGDVTAAENRATAIGVTFIGRDLGVSVAAGISGILVAWGQNPESGGGDGKRFALYCFGGFLLVLAPLCRWLPKSETE